jgi:hypothetical protein
VKSGNDRVPRSCPRPVIWKVVVNVADDITEVHSLNPSIEKLFGSLLANDRINNRSDGLLAGRADFHHGLLDDDDELSDAEPRVSDVEDLLLPATIKYKTAALKPLERPFPFRFRPRVPCRHEVLAIGLD